MMAGVAPAFGGAPNHRPPGRRGARTPVLVVPTRADVRTARRNADKAARDALAGTLVGAAGELGVARATQQEASAGVDAAAEKGRQLLEAAQLEAAALLDRAQAERDN